MKILIFGSTGFLGKRLVALCKLNQIEVYCAESRLENRHDIEKELNQVEPTHVFNVAGLTGRPNVDWCETHREDTILINIVGTLSLIDLCFRKNIHITNFATGCIYEYDGTEYSQSYGFHETDKPNFEKSFYSKTKIMAEELITNYSNVLQLRVRMPLSDDLNSRNFITKISNYERVVDIPNSMTILHDLLPLAIEMAQKELTGIYNFTNPGTISHNEILTLYKKYINSSFTWQNFTLEEQSKILKAGRSNNRLNTEKLESIFPNIPKMPGACEQLFIRMADNLKKDPNCTFSL